MFISSTISPVDLSDSQHLMGSVKDLFNKMELASDACIVRKILDVCPSFAQKIDRNGFSYNCTALVVESPWR